MNKEDTDKFKDKVEELIRTSLVETGQVCEEKLLLKLCSYAVEQSRIYIPIREELSLTHGTGVNATQLDFIMMSIISISWAVRMRKTIRHIWKVVRRLCLQTIIQNLRI
jgi:hypothetical protein